MNIAETVTAMRRLYEHRPVACFSDPARSGAGPGFRCAGTALFGTDPSAQVASAQTVTVVRRGRVATMLTHDGTTSRSRWSRARYRDGVSPTISVKRELNEPSDVQPTATQGVGDRDPLTKRSLGALDASRHEIGVGRLAIRRTELAREVCGRHERGTGHGRDIEGLRVVAVYEVARPAHVHEIDDLLRRHADDVTRPVTVGCAGPAAIVTSDLFRRRRSILDLAGIRAGFQP
jgi:hypothetical protein